jgi:hypothetical protein
MVVLEIESYSARGEVPKITAFRHHTGSEIYKTSINSVADLPSPLPSILFRKTQS